MTTDVTFAMPSNPEDKKNILRAAKEICDSFTRIQGEKDFIKAEVEALSEKYEIPKKILNRFVRAFYKSNIKDVQGDTEELIAFYENITGEAVE